MNMTTPTTAPPTRRRPRSSSTRCSMRSGRRRSRSSILSTVSTLASVAYGKLEMKDTPEAKKAIDAIDALLPLLEGEVDDDMRKEFEQAVTGLKLAYADAVSASE